MSGGFLSRIRFRRDAEGLNTAPGGSNTLPAHEAAHTQQDQGTAPESPDQGDFVQKVGGPDLNAEGNEVAMETLELSHEGLEIEAGDGGGLTLAQYAINGNSPAPEGDSAGVNYTMFHADGTPLRSEPGAPDGLAGEASSDEEAMAIEKLELAHEKVEHVPASAGDDAPEFQSALITETTFPALDASSGDSAPEDLGSAEPEGSSEYGAVQGWPAKWYVPELDSSESDPGEMTTLIPLTESKEMTGVITHLSPDQSTELFDDGDDDTDLDDLA